MDQEQGKKILALIKGLADELPSDQRFDRHVENLHHLQETVEDFFNIEEEE